MTDKKMKRGDKRGQVAIFIIIGIVIVIAGVLIYFFAPGLAGPTTKAIAQDPASYIKSCLEGKNYLSDTMNKIGLQGGDYDPTNYIIYKGNRLRYLCYTPYYYQLCSVREPDIIKRVESQIKSSIDAKAGQCFDSLEKTLQDDGYDVSLRRGDFSVTLLPEKVLITFNNSMTISKDEVDKFDSITVIKSDNNLYELLNIANSIVEWETSYGDSETTTYMNYYHDLKVEKYVQTEGSTIYVLTNRKTGDVFQFASRSLVWPPGFGIEE